MRLQELLKSIIESDPNDWYTISSPTFRDRLIGVSSSTEGHWLEINSHHTTAVYKPDVSITLAWGLDWKEDFDEPWAKSCPDPSASGDYVDVYYNGSLVFRTVYITVDCGRAKLPMPMSRTDLNVARNYYHFVQLIDSIGGYVSQYDSYFRRVGLQIDEGREWPEF